MLAAEKQGFTWSVHRPHTLIGYTVGNQMNMAATLAAYAAICRETGEWAFCLSRFAPAV